MNTNMPREVSPHDEFLHWLREQCKEWTKPINARDIDSEQVLGMLQSYDFVGKEILKKLKELEL